MASFILYERSTHKSANQLKHVSCYMIMLLNISLLTVLQTRIRSRGNWSQMQNIQNHSTARCSAARGCPQRNAFTEASWERDLKQFRSWTWVYSVYLLRNRNAPGSQVLSLNDHKFFKFVIIKAGKLLFY